MTQEKIDKMIIDLIDRADHYEKLGEAELLNCPPLKESERFWFWNGKKCAILDAINALNADQSLPI